MQLSLTILIPQEPMETEFKTAEIYNSNIGHNLASLHSFLTEKIGLLSPVSS